MKKLVMLAFAVFALNALPMAYADEPSADTAASDPLPEGVAPLPDFVPAE
ncbi:hypothetical protein MCEORH2_00637 [Methylophilaceae bacterium]